MSKKKNYAPRNEEDALVEGLLKLVETITIAAPANATPFAIAQHAAASSKLAETENMSAVREVVLKGADILIERYRTQTKQLS